MPISPNTYATVAQVEIMVGDIVPNRTFSVTTTPTLSQVETLLDLTASELNRELRAAGYTAPLSTGTDPIEHNWLTYINMSGASAQVLQSFPMVAITLDSEDAGNNRAQNLQRVFDRGLTTIQEQRLDAERVRGRLGGVYL